jgi:hypothetical protein
VPQEAWKQIAFVGALILFVALFVAGYRGLLRLFQRRFRQRGAPQPPTLAHRWLAAFVSVTPLCIFGAYFIVQARPNTVRNALAFGLLGALLAATSGVSLGAAARNGRPAPVAGDLSGLADTTETANARTAVRARGGR